MDPPKNNPNLHTGSAGFPPLLGEKSLQEPVSHLWKAETMNDYEIMNQRVDQLRHQLDRVHDEEELLTFRKNEIMDELLDTRRQILRADRAKIAAFEQEPPKDL